MLPGADVTVRCLIEINIQGDMTAICIIMPQIRDCRGFRLQLQMILQS
jgi:hypothetical protein